MIPRDLEYQYFGKSLHELFENSKQIATGCRKCQTQLQETLQRIANEGGGGLICSILKVTFPSSGIGFLLNHEDGKEKYLFKEGGSPPFLF